MSGTMKYRRSVTAALLLIGVSAPAAIAQDRFRVESRDALPQSSLVIYTLRDSQLSVCYTLFVLEPPPPPASVVTSTEPAPPSNKFAEARAARDEQLAALRVRVDARTPSDRVGHAIEDQAASKKIEDVFDHAILGVPMMTTLPWAVPLPGMQTSGTQYQAESTRRATVDPTSDRATVDSNARLENWLMQAAQMPRMAAAGPISCKPGGVNNVKP
jgi:hypothetical protein